MQRTAVLLMLVAAISCAKKSEAPKASSAAAVTPAPAAPAQEPAFDLRSAWLAKQVVIKTVSGGEPSMSYTITPKNAKAFVAVELAMTRDAATPVRANYSKLVLLTPAGARTNALFEYPASVTEVGDDGDTVTFTDDPSKLINGTLSGMGGKLIAVFEAPPDTNGLKLEVAGVPGADVVLKR